MIGLGGEGLETNKNLSATEPKDITPLRIHSMSRQSPMVLLRGHGICLTSPQAPWAAGRPQDLLKTMQTLTGQSETQRTQGETCSAGERKVSRGRDPGPPGGPRGPGRAPSGCVCSSRTWSGRSSRTQGRGTSSPRRTPSWFWGLPCRRRRSHWRSASLESSGHWRRRGHRRSRNSQSDPDVSISGLLGENKTQRRDEASLWRGPLLEGS